MSEVGLLVFRVEQNLPKCIYGFGVAMLRGRAELRGNDDERLDAIINCFFFCLDVLLYCRK